MNKVFLHPPRVPSFLTLTAVLALAGCSEGFQPFGEDGFLPIGNATTRNAAADGPASIGATQLVERDVEAPEIFEITEAGLWDGRPSLGGVWVAHPDVTDPERVIIRNSDNGRFVIGALFRRERDNPGPAIMVSSDAAAALNVLAGAPTTLQVTALRREEAPEPVAEEEVDLTFPDAETPDGAVAAAGAITATALDDPLAAAAAAIDASEASAAVEAAPVPAAAPVAAATAPTPEAPAGSDLDRAFVQIGIFSVEENANNTGQALRGAGLVPTIYEQSANDSDFWRVVVGPARTEGDRDAILASVRGLGFEDAYFVSR